MKHEHVVPVRHYPPFLLCSPACGAGFDALAGRLTLWGRSRAPAKHSRPGVLLPLP